MQNRPKRYTHAEFMAELAKSHPRNWTEAQLVAHCKADPEHRAAYTEAMIAGRRPQAAAGTETAASKQPEPIDLEAAYLAAEGTEIVKAATRLASRPRSN
jgi:ferric-dicitrate binding protein FerR (iron transport regulator)